MACPYARLNMVSLIPFPTVSSSSMFRLARPRFSLRFKLLLTHLLVLAPFPVFFNLTQRAISDAAEQTQQETARALKNIPVLQKLESRINAFQIPRPNDPGFRIGDASEKINKESGHIRSSLDVLEWDDQQKDSFITLFELYANSEISGSPPADANGTATLPTRLDEVIQQLWRYHNLSVQKAVQDLSRENQKAIDRWVYGMGFALGLAVIVTLLLTRTLLRPLVVLEETLRAYERGEAPPKPERLPSDEIGDLGRSMREALSKMDDQRERLERLSLTDPLTGLHNRRYLDEILGRLRKRETPAAFVMIDIDHFKAYNDREGHLMGDQLLQEVAGLLHRNVRPGDVVARYGGEEFCALFLDAAPGERPAGPETVERLRILFANPPFPRTESQPGGRLTISIGGAHWKPGEDPLAALKRADTALYQAKQSGRNRCAWA